MSSFGPEKPSKVRWIVFVLLFGTSWLLYVHRYIFGYIKPAIAEEYDLSTTELGALDSAFSASYSLFQFPLGIAADVLGVYLILPILIVVWCIGLAMHAWAPSMTALWWARITLGGGQSAVFANLNRAGRAWFPYRIRTTLQGLVGVLAGRLGGLSAALIFGYLLLGVFELEWRTAVYLLAAIGIGLAAIFLFVYRNSPRKHPWVNEAEADLLEEGPEGATEKAKDPPKKMPIKVLLRRMKPRAIVNLVCINAQSILSTFADNIYSNWIPLFLFQVYALKFKEMGIYAALPLAGGALGGFLGGFLNDYFIAKTGNRRWARSGVAAAGKGMAAILLFTAMLWYDQPYIFCGFLFFVKLFGDWSLTTLWGTVTDIGGRATASVFSFNNAIAGVGSVLAPLIFGVIADESGWRWVFITAGVAYILCALSWLLINCTIPMIDETEELPEEK